MNDDTTNVTAIENERLIREGEAAVDHYNKANASARREILPMARGLLAARRKYPADRDFGDWLWTSAYREINDPDRAALIKIGEHDDFAAKFIPTTHLSSPRLIWDAMKTLLSALAMEAALASALHTKKPTLVLVQAEQPVLHDVKPAEVVHLPTQSDAQASTAPVASVSVQAETQKSTDTSPSRSYDVTGKRDSIKDVNRLELPKRLGLPADDVVKVLAAYPSHRQKSIKSEFTQLVKPHSRNKAAAIQLFLRAIEVVASNRAPQSSNTAGIDIRMFFPDLPDAWCRHMTINDAIKSFDRLMTVNERAAELALQAAPMAIIFRELSHLYETGRSLPPPAPVQFPANSRIKHEVKYCGVVIWPADGMMDISYEDLKAGWHLADHWLKTLEVATPRKPNEVLHEVGHLQQDIRAASTLDGLTRVMSACIAAYARRNQRQEKADFDGGMPPGIPR